MTLKMEDYTAVHDALQVIYAAQSPDEFIVCAMRTLPALMNSDMAAYNEVDYGARRMTTIIDSADGQLHWHEIQLVFETLMNQNPLIAYSAKTRGQPKKISDFITSEEWRNTAIYQAVYSRIKAEHQIAVALLLDEDIIVAFAFNREVRDFTERERALLTLLQPHLTQAYRNTKSSTQMRARANRSEQSLETLGAGWIDIDRKHRIVQATELARNNLNSFFEQPYAADDRLPPALEKWIIGLEGRATSTAEAAPLVIRTGTGRLIVRLLSVDPAGNYCLSTECFVDAKSPRPLERLGLTPRQAEVLYWICQGKSNAEIAVILKISVRTVTFHVSHILGVLNVDNRTEAANVATRQLTLT